MLEGEGYSLVEFKSAKEITATCPKGHVWRFCQADFVRRGVRCPCFSNLLRYTQESLSKEYAGFGFELLPLISRPNSSVPHLVRCKNGHEIRLRISDARRGIGCSRCSRNYMHTIDEARALLKKHGYTLVTDEYTGNKQKLETICPNGTKYLTSFNQFDRGGRCWCCVVADIRKKLQLEIEPDGYEVLPETIKDREFKTLFSVKCPKGHVTAVYPNNYLRGNRCRVCALHNKSSKGQTEIQEYVSSLGFRAGSDTEVLGRKEIDVYVPSKRVGIEHNGNYWHSEKFRDPDYHLQKLEAATAAGIRLLQFWEDEWENKRAVVEEIIKRALDVPCRRVGARACSLRVLDVPTRRHFLDQYHLQGDTRAPRAWGLYLGDELLQALSVRRTYYDGGDPRWEIARVASKFDVVVVGGLSRLVAQAKAYVKSRDGDSLWTFADRRYSLGTGYVKAGFLSEGASAPGFWYVNGSERVHRYTLRKSKDCPETMTNDEYRESQGWVKLWDCGQLRFRVGL